MVSCEGGYEESNWDSVTEPVMHIVFDRLSLRDQRNCRLVSKRWSQMVITNVKVLPLPSTSRNFRAMQQDVGLIFEFN
jgi:hypothetical protein